jgi:mRNA interferase RelE/StbE
MYSIKLTQIAAEQLKAIESNTLDQILHKIESLKQEPLLLGKPLKGLLREYRSIRAAGQRYRIIYRVLNEEIVVIIVAVGIRKEGDKKDIYELMKNILKQVYWMIFPLTPRAEGLTF